MYACRPGSVIAEFNIIMSSKSSSGGGKVVDASDIQTSLTNVVTSGNLTVSGVSVDRSFTPNITGEIPVTWDNFGQWGNFGHVQASSIPHFLSQFH